MIELVSNFCFTFILIVLGLLISAFFFLRPSSIYNDEVSLWDIINKLPEKYRKPDIMDYWKTNQSAETFLKNKTLEIIRAILASQRDNHVSNWAGLWAGYFVILFCTVLFEANEYCEKCQREIEPYRVEKKYKCRDCLENLKPMVDGDRDMIYKFRYEEGKDISLKCDSTMTKWSIYSSSLNFHQDIPCTRKAVICPLYQGSFHVYDQNTGQEIDVIKISGLSGRQPSPRQTHSSK